MSNTYGLNWLTPQHVDIFMPKIDIMPEMTSVSVSIWWKHIQWFPAMRKPSLVAPCREVITDSLYGQPGGARWAILFLWQIIDTWTTLFSHFFWTAIRNFFFGNPTWLGFCFFSSTWVSGKHKPKSLVPGPCHGGCRGGTITDPALEPRGGTMTSCGWSKIHHFKGTTWGFYGIQWGYGNIVTSRWILWDMNGPKKTTTFRMLLSILILGELVSFNVERSSEFNGPISAVYNISILRRPTPNFWFWPWTPCSGLLSPDTRLHIPQIGDTL